MHHRSVLVAATLLSCGVAGAQSPTALRDAIRRYAAPNLEGRGNGQEGYRRAAEVAARRFREIGLKPAGDGGTYFQAVPFFRYRIAPDSVRFSVEGRPVEVRGGASLAALGGATTGEGALVRLSSSGGAVPAGVSLKDKIVVLANDIPESALYPILGQNPVAVFRVLPRVARYDWTVSPDRDRSPKRYLVGDLSEAAARTLFAAAGVPEWGARGAAVADGATSPRVVRLDARLEQEEFSVPNVVGRIEGTDPALRERAVILAAGLDGRGRHGSTTSPSVDGATTAALLEAVAGAIAAPKRTVYVVALCGVERGAAGARWLAARLPVPAERLDGYVEIGAATTGPDDATIQTRTDVEAFAVPGVPTFAISARLRPGASPEDRIEAVSLGRVAELARAALTLIADRANGPTRRAALPEAFSKKG